MNEFSPAPGLEVYSHLLNAAHSVADESVRRLQALAERYPGAVPADALAQLLEAGLHQPHTMSSPTNAAQSQDGQAR